MPADPPGLADFVRRALRATVPTVLRAVAERDARRRAQRDYDLAEPAKYTVIETRALPAPVAEDE